MHGHNCHCPGDERDYRISFERAPARTRAGARARPSNFGHESVHTRTARLGCGQIDTRARRIKRSVRDHRAYRATNRASCRHQRRRARTRKHAESPIASAHGTWSRPTTVRPDTQTHTTRVMHSQFRVCIKPRFVARPHAHTRAKMYIYARVRSVFRVRGSVEANESRAGLWLFDLPARAFYRLYILTREKLQRDIMGLRNYSETISVKNQFSVSAPPMKSA